MSIQGGYKTQTVSQVANVISAYDRGEISLSAVRVYFATLVSVASREAAKRSKINNKTKQEVIPRYLVKELSKTTGMTLRRVKKELLILKKLEILIFGESEIVFETSSRPGSFGLSESLAGNRSPFRPVPLPRPLLRFLAQCSKASTIKTALAYSIRGLTLSRTGDIKGKGSVKATSIAEVMNLSERSVRSARSELLALGWLVDDEGSKQWKLNRDGAYFAINLSWIGKAREVSKEANTPQEMPLVIPTVEQILEPVGEAKPLEVEEILPLNIITAGISNFAPPLPQNCTNFAPPYKDKKTLNRSKNQKTWETKPTGVCVAKEFKTGDKSNVVPLPRERKVSIWDVKLDNLKEFSLLEELFFQAVKAGIVDGSESTAVNFLATAVKVKRVVGVAPQAGVAPRVGDPVRVFMGIIRKKLWSHLSQADEDRALCLLRKHREKDCQRFRVQIRKAA